MAADNDEVIHTKIWFEEASDRPFHADACYCGGYDVYGDLLGKAGLLDYLYLLFKLDPPSTQQKNLLNKLAVGLANPGPRDLSVRAAMTAAVGGSTAASSLIAAISVGAGKFGGAREVYLCARLWSSLQTDINKWSQALQEKAFEPEQPEVWPAMEHAPGFDPYTDEITKPNLQFLTALTAEYRGGALGFLSENRESLEAAAGSALGVTGIAAAALVDIGFNDEQAEMLFLLLRLPGAAAHALEQREYGWRQYPFFSRSLVLSNDPRASGSRNAKENHDE